MRQLSLLAMLLVATAAAPAPDPLLRQLIKDARAVKPTPFERTQRIEDGDKVHTFTDRYDPALVRPWKLIAIDGRAPKPGEAPADWARTTQNAPPSYGRVALLLAAAKPVDATHYHVQPLPKGFLKQSAMAEHAAVDLTIDTSGTRPFVSAARFYLTEPFRMFVVAKIDKYEATNHYVLDADGVARIASQDQLFVISGLSPIGTQKISATFAPLGR